MLVLSILDLILKFTLSGWQLSSSHRGQWVNRCFPFIVGLFNCNTSHTQSSQRISLKILMNVWFLKFHKTRDWPQSGSPGLKISEWFATNLAQECQNGQNNQMAHHTHIQRKATSTIEYVCAIEAKHDDVIKWKHFPRNWPFVVNSPNSPRKDQWRGALMVYLICAWINDWVNNGEVGDLRRHRGHYDVNVMACSHRVWKRSVKICDRESIYGGSGRPKARMIVTLKLSKCANKFSLYKLRPNSVKCK